MMIPKNTINEILRTVLTVICLLLPACGWFGAKQQQNLKTIYRDIYLINVNDKELFDDSRILGSLNIPYDELEENAKSLDKNYELVFYCTDYACTESDRAAKLMRSLGFEKVLVYPGGIHEWYQLSLEDSKKYPIEGPSTQKFLLRPIAKFNREEVNSISAEKLSNLLLSSKLE